MQAAWDEIRTETVNGLVLNYGGAAPGLRDRARSLNIFPVRSSIGLSVCSVSAWLAV